MSTRALLLASVAAATISFPTLAQVAPLEVEGRLNAITVSPTAPTTTIDSLRVFNSTIRVKPGTTFSSPTKEGMSAAEIITCNGRRFAGFTRNNPSWVGGTAIVTGTSDDAGGKQADTVFLEPAENVLLGRVSKIPDFVKDPLTGLPVLDPVTKLPTYLSGTLEIEDTQVIILGVRNQEHYPPTDVAVPFNPCVPGTGVKNDFGFKVPAEALEVGDEAAAEGWYGDDGKFYAFLVESTAVLTDPVTGVSINRAQCRNRGGNIGMEWEIRGGVSNPASGTVNIGRPVPDPLDPTKTVYRAYTGITATATADPAAPGYGTYTFKGNIPNGNGNGTCPSTVIVRFSGANARATVDVR
jgi:hypothetical protein